MKNTWKKGLIAASIALGLIAVGILWPPKGFSQGSDTAEAHRALAKAAAGADFVGVYDTACPEPRRALRADVAGALPLAGVRQDPASKGPQRAVDLEDVQGP